MNKHKLAIAICILMATLLSLGCGLGQKLAPTPTPTYTYTPTNTPTPTDTPVPTATFTPTNTPVPTATFTPTNTPEPTATSTPLPPTPIPGWNKFEGGGVELWLPDNFEGGDIANDLSVIVDRLRSLGPQYTQLANMIEQNPTAFALIIYDTKIGASGFLTSVNIVKEQVLSAVTLDIYMDQGTSQLEAYGFNVIDRKIIHLDNYDAGRLIVEAASIHAKEVLYAIKDKNIVWVITYATGMDEFDTRLPIFEQSANTFKVQP